MSTYDPHGDRSISYGGQQQAMISAQLQKAIQTMFSIDELFQWFGYAIVQQFNLQIAQFWTPILNPNGLFSPHLRVMAIGDSSIPEKVLLNDHVVLAVRGIEHEQRMIPSRPVEALFSAQQVSWLKHYGLHYCAGGFTRNDALLPPPTSQAAFSSEPVPFALTTLLFLTQRPHWNMMPSISALLKDVVNLATSHSLLMSSTPLPAFASPLPRQETRPSFPLLIPRRKESSQMMVTDNPFSRESAISDKQANRLHSAIDGKRTISDLARRTNMDLNDAAQALQILLQLNRTELLDSTGQIVNPKLFFPDIDL